MRNVILLAAALLASASPAEDCDRNGVDDAQDVAPSRYGFLAPLHQLTEQGPVVGLVAADFDGDGRSDIATASAGTFDPRLEPELTVHLGAGDGTFQPGKPLEGFGPGPVPPGPLAAADFDGDGDLDLATTTGPSHPSSRFAPTLVRVLLNLGGSFEESSQRRAARTVTATGRATPATSPRARRRTATATACRTAASPMATAIRTASSTPARSRRDRGPTATATGSRTGARSSARPSTSPSTQPRRCPPAPGTLGPRPGSSSTPSASMRASREPPPPAPPGPPANACRLDPDPPGSARDLGCERYDHCP